MLAGHHMGSPQTLSQDVFERQLTALSRTSSFIRIEDACRLIQDRVEVDESLIAFTFDDGFADWHTHIAPALEKFGTNAAFFVNPGYVDADSNYVAYFNDHVVRSPGKLPVSSGQLKDLADRGFLIGAHTIDHVDVSGNDIENLEPQIVGCRRAVEQLSGRPCEWFAWTYGTFRNISPEALQLARKTYDLVFSSAGYPYYSTLGPDVLNRRHVEPFWPVAHANFFLRRNRVHAS